MTEIPVAESTEDSQVLSSISEKEDKESKRYSFRRLFRFASKYKEPSLSSVKWTELRRALHFVKPHRALLIWLCICFVINQILVVVVPVSFGYLIDRVLPQKDISTLNIIVEVLFAFLVVRSIFVYLERQLSAKLGTRVVQDVRVKLHNHFLKMSLEYLDRYQVGRAVARIMGDTECVRNLLFNGLMNGTASVIRFVIVIGTLFWLDWRLTLISCLGLPFFLIGFWQYTKKLKPAYYELSEDNAEMVTSVQETFNGIRVVKTYCGEYRANSDFRTRCTDILYKTLFIARTQHISTIIWEGTACLGVIALVWYGGHRVVSGAMTVGEFVAFYALLSQLQGPIADIIGINATLQPAIASLELIGEVLDQNPDIEDSPDSIMPENLRGNVRFNNVKFTYKTQNAGAPPPPETEEAEPETEEQAAFAPLEEVRRYTLENISFEAKSGECIAIVGPSGSGKSTLINLLTRMYEVDAGLIEIDGANIKDYKLTEYLSNFAIVQQESFLFRGSIRENIRYSRADASDQEVVDAAKAAGAYDFIQEIPTGLDTLCGERGVRLSGGQKQRICIARAILANPRILILDEATSALDSYSEAQIQSSLDHLMKDRTTFVIAHRLSTIVNADRILFLDKGKILESGSHKELMELKGRYAELFNIQMGRVQAATEKMAVKKSQTMQAA